MLLLFTRHSQIIERNDKALSIILENDQPLTRNLTVQYLLIQRCVFRHGLSRVLSRRCPSPEKDTPWPYEYESCPEKTTDDDPEARRVVGRSRTSPLTCGLCQQNDFTKYLDRLSKITRSYIQQHCPVVIYSVKFGKMNKPLSKRFNLTASQNSTGINNCLILFMIGEEEEGEPGKIRTRRARVCLFPDWDSDATRRERDRGRRSNHGPPLRKRE